MSDRPQAIDDGEIIAAIDRRNRAWRAARAAHQSVVYALSAVVDSTYDEHMARLRSRSLHDARLRTEAAADRMQAALGDLQTAQELFQGLVVAAIAADEDVYRKLTEAGR